MNRNQPGDTETAKQLLQQVIQKDQEGKETAQEWLRKMELFIIAVEPFLKCIELLHGN